MGGGTEDLKIIASISQGYVGDGNGGISQRSSQSNGIYVQHSGLQPGNKCLSLALRHFLTPLVLSLSVTLSPLYLQYLSFLPPCAAVSASWSVFFCFLWQQLACSFTIMFNKAVVFCMASSDKDLTSRERLWQNNILWGQNNTHILCCKSLLFHKQMQTLLISKSCNVWRTDIEL